MELRREVLGERHPDYAASLTGLAVSPHGTIYASEVLFNAPAGDPPPGFDPSAVAVVQALKWRKGPA